MPCHGTACVRLRVCKMSRFASASLLGHLQSDLQVPRSSSAKFSGSIGNPGTLVSTQKAEKAVICRSNARWRDISLSLRITMSQDSANPHCFLRVAFAFFLTTHCVGRCEMLTSHLHILTMPQTCNYSRSLLSFCPSSIHPFSVYSLGCEVDGFL